MRLYFNGCSHTYGDDLLDRTTAWPSLIAKKYNCNFLNDSVSGGTNQRIIYRTIKHIDQFDKFYIAWTYTNRFTRWRGDNNFEVNFNSQLRNPLYDKTDEYKIYGKLHYKYWFNELYAFKFWLQEIILLQKLFESMNKQYIMINTCENSVGRWTVTSDSFNYSVKSLLCFDFMNDDQLQAEHNEIQHLIKHINFDYYIGWNNYWLTSIIQKYPVGVTGHLLEQGHQENAQYIINHDTY